MSPSILQPFSAWAEREPDHRLFAFLDGDGRVTASYTYAEFARRTAQVAAHVRRTSSLRAGDRVLLVYPPGLDLVCAFFACVRLGCIPVPVYPPGDSGFQLALQRADHIAADCEAAAVLTTRAFYWSMRLHEARAAVATRSIVRPAVSRLPWIVSTDADADDGADDTLAAAAHSDVLFLQYTSGSTTAPRGVMVTHANVLANCADVVDHRPVGVSWLPQYHDMGLIGYYLFFALTGGTTYGFSPLDFIRRPALWLETITRYRGTASSAPNFAYAYCLRPDRIPDAALARLDLSSLRFLMTAAEPVRPDVCAAFRRRFAACGLDPRSLFAAYGLAEFTLAVSNYGRATQRLDRAALARNLVRPAPPDAPDAATATLASCGRPLGATDVRIVDVDVGGAPRPAAPDAVGEIWLRGPAKCAGYWRRPALTAATFAARLADDDDDDHDGDGWLRTGDLGFVHDGELYVCGRTKDLLIVRGQNHYPQDVEAVVERCADVRPGAVAAFAVERAGGETLVVVAESRSERRLPDARLLNQQLLRQLGIAATTYVFLPPRTIPKTSSGKIMRHLVRQRWLDGALPALAVVEPAAAAPVEAASGADDSRAWLAPFGLTGDESGTLADAGLDSLRLAEFALALEERLEARGAHARTDGVDLAALQRIAICELVALVEQVAAAPPLARRRLDRALHDLGRDHHASVLALMRQDAGAPVDPAVRARAHAAPIGDGGVLLTGGTGFFGPFLLASLLARQPDDVHVLMRGGGDAMARLQASLRAVTADGAGLPRDWARRVHPVRGDLAAPDLGLDGTTWRRLAGSMHAIYHNGAAVNYLLDYAALRDANVGGTRAVVRLAASGRPTVLNHVSTTFVFGWSVQETLGESDTNPGMERLDFGYSQSKWVAEQVVRAAMREGLDARIFRPALLAPSPHGGGAHFDIAIRLLSFMLRHGITTSASNQVSFTPADVAADNVVAISRLPASVGRTFHVTRDAYASLGDVTAILGELTGRRFRAYPLADFVPEVIARCRPGDVLFPLLNFLVRSVDGITAMEFKRYDNANYRHFRDAAGGRADPPLRDVVLGMLRFMHRHGLADVGRTAAVADAPGAPATVRNG